MSRAGRALLLTALILVSSPLRAQPPGAEVVVADDGYAALARRSGEWTATRAVSVPQTEMFVPRRVKVLEFGKGQPDPKVATRWRAQQAWIACDGSVGVTFGRWAIPGTRQRGWYEAIWGLTGQGTYKLLLRHAGPVERHLDSRPGRRGLRAACGGHPPPLPIVAPGVGTDFRMGASRDQTLIWSSGVNAQGDVRIAISLWNGTTHVPVLEDVAPARAAR
jgi:hypothetical protein